MAETEITWEGLLGRERCCDKDFGGSHYHCGACGEVASMQGHYLAVEFVEGKRKLMEGHMCCPGACQSPESHGKTPPPGPRMLGAS